MPKERVEWEPQFGYQDHSTAAERRARELIGMHRRGEYAQSPEVRERDRLKKARKRARLRAAS